MEKYNISFAFDNTNSLNDIFIKVLLKEIKMILRKESIVVSSSYTNLSLDKGGIGKIPREYE